MQKIEKVTDKVILATLGSITFLALFFTRAAEMSGMSIGFAGQVSRDVFVFHPHHLLYQSVLNVLHGLFGSTHCSAICIGQLHSIFWGVVTVLSVYVISRHTLPTKLGAIITSISIVVTHGFAVYATQLEPYIPILGMSSLLAAILVARGSQDLGWKHEILFISIISTSLLFHQAMLFFFVPIAYWLIANNGKSGLVSVIRMIAVAGVIVLSTFAAAFWSTYPGKDPVDFFRWIMYYQTIGDPSDIQGTFQGLLDERLRATAYAIQKLFVAIPGQDMPDLAFFFRLLVSIYVPLLILWNSYQIFRSEGTNKVRTFMFIWAGVFAIFFFWWSASVYKFYILILVPIVILTSVSINDIMRAWRDKVLARKLIPGITLAGLVFIAGLNLMVSVLPLSRSPGAIYDLANKLASAAPAECNIYSMRFLSGYISYYFGRSPRPFNLMFRKQYFSTRDTAVAETIGVDFHFDDERCATIPLHWVSREYFEARSQTGMGRYLSPNDWSLFVEWFFEVKDSLNSAEVSFSSFSVTEDADGDRYLIIDRTNRQSVVSIDELLERLDTLYALRPARSFGDRPDIGQHRRLEFGYN